MYLIECIKTYMAAEKFTWSKEYSVNNEILDEQHRHMCEVANQIADLGQEKPIMNIKEKLLFLLTKLGDNVLYHFDTEEEMMKKQNLPGTTEHLEKHKLYKKEIAKFIERVREGTSDGIELHKEVMDFISEWITKHMLGIKTEAQVVENDQK